MPGRFCWSIARHDASPWRSPRKQAGAQGGSRASPSRPRQPAAAENAKQEPRRRAEKTHEKKAAKPTPLAGVLRGDPLAERLAIQNDLVWTGDYNGPINGEFGERAIAAVKAFQKRNGGKETGVLQPAGARRAGRRRQAEAGRGRLAHGRRSGDRRAPRHAGQADAADSAIIRRHRAGASARGEYSVETFRIAQPGTTLAAVFERMKKEPAGRKADYSVLRGDFFVISGLQNLKKFYVRAQLRGDEVRGFTVLYDQAMAGIMEPVVVAMSSAYAAFPGAGAMPPPRRKVEYASGVVVGARPYPDQPRGARRLLRHHGRRHRRRGSRRRGQGERPRAAARLWRGPEAAGARRRKPQGADVTLVGIADPQAQGGGGAVSAAKARVSDTLTLEPAPASVSPARRRSMRRGDSPASRR